LASALNININELTTHNLWDASQVNAFGSQAIPTGNFHSNAIVLNSQGKGATP
jgi:hypothetical protein